MISDFIKHLQFEKRYSSNTYESYQNDLEQFQSFLAVRYDLSDLKAVQTLHIRSWVVSMIQQKLSPSSIHRKASSLKSFYKFLRQDLKKPLFFNGLVEIIFFSIIYILLLVNKK